MRALKTHFSVLLAMSACLYSHPAQPAEKPTYPQYVSPNIYTPQSVVREMLRLAEVKAGELVVDLGCGDGRIVIQAAQAHKARGLGIDLDQKQIALSRANAKKSGVVKSLRFIQQDMFKTDLSQADVVALFLFPKALVRLRPVLEKSLQKGDRVVTHQFEIPGWHHYKSMTMRDERRFQRQIFLYRIGQHRIPPKKLP